MVTLHAFTTPKDGSAPDENDDAYFVPAPVGWPLRLAVADGATGASFSGLWASLLANAYGSGASLPDTLLTLGRQWRQEIAKQPLEWYAEEKVRAGGFAAFLGLTLYDEGTWEALAVGDCCLFQLRGEELVTAFPLTRGNDFSDSPALIGTYPAQNERLSAHLCTETGTFAPGDLFLLMSDALAAYFLQAKEQGRSPEKWLLTPLSKTSPTPFAELVTELRQTGHLANDDTTLVIVQT